MSTPLLAATHKQIKGGPLLSALSHSVPGHVSTASRQPASVIGPGAAEDEVGGEEEKKGKGQPKSKVEMDRQRILEEMKKRTQLLTDNSWIRQRSSSSSIGHKEPHYLGFALKR